MPRGLSAERTGPSRPLIVAVVITGLTALLLIGLAISVMAQGNGDFSLGVGLSLLMYGLLVAGVTVLGARRSTLGYGPIVGVNVLHGCVIASTAMGSQAWWLWFGLVPVVAAILCLLLPDVRVEFGRGGAQRKG